MLKNLFAIATVFSFSLAAQKPADAGIAQLQRDLTGWMQQGDVPGVSIAVLRHGKTAWIGSYGIANKATRQAVTDRTVFNAASLSKTVFAYTVLRFVDQGKIDLDTPLTRYVRDRPSHDPRLDKITARIVLSHRTGFPNWRNDAKDELQIYFDPGSRFSYSGEGMVYLQHAVEAITGKPLNQVITEQVFQPLGMTESSYTARPDLAGNFAMGYSADGRVVALFQNTGANAAASLNTTAHDYALFLEAVLSGRGLEAATLREMETPEIAVDPTCTNCLDAAPKTLSTDLFWGLGWGIEKNASGTYLWHWGDNGIFKAYVVADIRRRSAIASFDNSSSGLSIAKAVTETALGGDHPAFGWLNYDTYDSPNARFARDLKAHGVRETLQDFAADIAIGKVSERAINEAGYQLLGEKQYADAITLFQRNVDAHPTSSNTYDSLGEAYVDDGQTELAVKNYEKVLALNPNSRNAKAMLEKLRASGKP
ncbi:MAG TPA: serine hydrolase [Vicinamibacterales bacterium]|nr:serine hydrolase [Vicinamibacterales bacterium]